MFQIGAARKEERRNAVAAETEIISAQKYNLILCGTVLWGLVFNYVICRSGINVFDYVNSVVFYIGYLVCAIVGILMSSKSQNPVVSFIGYNLVVVPFGLVISCTVDMLGGMNSSIVSQAFLITMCIVGMMLLVAMYFPDVCAKFGRILLISLCGVILAGILSYALNLPNSWISWVSALIFSGYIAYDVYRAQEYEKTVDNAVDSAVDIYIDIVNLFLNILEIVARSNSKSHRD